MTRPSLLAVAVATLVVLGAPNVGAQEPVGDDPCIGAIDAAVSAESLPSGRWSTSGGCLTADRFFEFSEGPVLAKAGLAEATYDDGHQGRVAAAVLTLGGSTGLAIVGVEDSATGVIKWSATLGDFESDGGSVSVEGTGVAVFPIEEAQVSATLTGTGTDVRQFLTGYETDPDAPVIGETVEPGSSDDVDGTTVAEPGSPDDGVDDDAPAVADDPGSGDTTDPGTTDVGTEQPGIDEGPAADTAGPSGGDGANAGA